LNNFSVSFEEFKELVYYGTFDSEFMIINFLSSDGDERRNDWYYEITFSVISTEKKSVYNKFCSILL